MVSGVAWVTRTGGGMDLHVLGKISLRLERDGQASLGDPEAPGCNLGCPAPEEALATTGRRLVVRGTRASGGRVMLRRGSTILVDAGFEPGADLVHHPLTGNAKTTMSGERGEWLVVEGAEHPQARRWCKLPKLGMVTTWREARDRLVLNYKLLLVDVGAWSVSFVYRGSRPLGPEGMPLMLDLSALNVEQLSALMPPSSPGLAPGSRGPVSHGLGSTMNLPDGNPLRPALPFETGRSPVFGPPPVPLTRSAPTGTAELVTPPGMRQRPKVPALFDEMTGTQTEVKPDKPPAAPTVAHANARSGAPLAATTDVRAELELRLKAGSSLVGLQLKGAKLDGISLRQARLAGLDLSMSDLRNADLTEADLSDAKLDDARLDGAKLDGATLSSASLDRASFRVASLRDVQGRACVGTEADFTDADLQNADLRGGQLVGARFTGARAQGLNAQGADLTGAVFTSARLERANLSDATLRRAQLKTARLTNCDLRNADLREIQGETALQGARLEGARRS